jgi:uncharacterized LabA/DUF88 family protein
MGVAALLIDWENLKIALINNYEFAAEDIARKLREAVAEDAKSAETDIRLDHAIAFAPALALDPHTSNALQHSQVTPWSTASSKQAADLAIAIRAMQLYYQNPGARYFVIVSGDSDYLPLAEELNKGGSQCYIWAVDKEHTPKRLRDMRFVAYVTEKIHLKRITDVPTPNEEDVFLLLVHRILDTGFYLGEINITLQKLAELGVWDHTKMQRMWNLFTSGDRRFIDALAGLDREGRVSKVRRLAYEREREVLRKIWAADLVLQRANRKGHLSRAEATSMLEQCGIQETRGSEFLAALCVSGYLTKSADDYVPCDAHSRYGLVGAAIRVALAFYAATCDGRQETLGLGQLIGRYWPRFYKPGGNLSDAEVRRSGDDARLAVNRAVAMRMAAWTHATNDRGQHVKAVTIFEDHPVVQLLRRQTHRLVTELARAGATPHQTVKYHDLIQHMAALPLSPWGGAEVDAWLSVLAAVRVVSWRDREITLNKTSLRELITKWG